MLRDLNVTPTGNPRCLHLRTKVDYITLEDNERPSGRDAFEDEDQTSGGTSHHYYCLQTRTVIGPDEDIVGPRVCDPKRECYESSGF